MNPRPIGKRQDKKLNDNVIGDRHDAVVRTTLAPAWNEVNRGIIERVVPRIRVIKFGAFSQIERRSRCH